MRIPFWADDPEAYCTIKIGPLEWSNVPVRVTGMGIDNKLDTKSPKGADGAQVTPHGGEARKFKIEIDIAREEDLRRYERIIPVLGVVPGKTQPQPTTIDYPLLALYGIRKAWVNRAPILVDKGQQIKTIVLECIEFIEPKPASSAIYKIKGAKVISPELRGEMMSKYELRRREIMKKDPRTGRCIIPYERRQQLLKDLDHQAGELGLDKPPSRTATKKP